MAVAGSVSLSVCACVCVDTGKGCRQKRKVGVADRKGRKDAQMGAAGKGRR